MIHLAMLLGAATVAAAPPTVTVGTGMQSRGAATSCYGLQPSGSRLAVQWHVANLEVGPVVRAANVGVCRPDEALGSLGNPLVVGNFFDLGVGPSVAMPALLEGRSLRLGARVDVLAYQMRLPLDEEVVERRITEEYGETAFGLVDYRFGGILGIDGALNLSARRPAPEFLVGLEAGYESGFGLVTGFNVGLRVGAGGS